MTREHLQCKERASSPIFVARFGLGTHTTECSDWLLTLREDIAAFFKPTEVPTSNILYMEDSVGSGSYLESLKRSYEVYQSWNLAFKHVNSRYRSLSREYPPPEKVESDYSEILSKTPETKRPTYLFILELFSTIDQLAAYTQTEIDVLIETRRTKHDLLLVKQRGLGAMDGIRISQTDVPARIKQAWTIRMMRNKDIAEDMYQLYKKALHRRMPTRVYVSLGFGHEDAYRLTTSRLGRKPQVEISLVKWELHEQYKDEPDFLIEEIFRLLDEGKHVPEERWKILFERTTPPIQYTGSYRTTRSD